MRGEGMYWHLVKTAGVWSRLLPAEKVAIVGMMHFAVNGLLRARNATVAAWAEVDASTVKRAREKLLAGDLMRLEKPTDGRSPGEYRFILDLTHPSNQDAELKTLGKAGAFDGVPGAVPHQQRAHPCARSGRDTTSSLSSSAVTSLRSGPEKACAEKMEFWGFTPAQVARYLAAPGAARIRAMMELAFDKDSPGAYLHRLIKTELKKAKLQSNRRAVVVAEPKREPAPGRNAPTRAKVAKWVGEATRREIEDLRALAIERAASAERRERLAGASKTLLAADAVFQKLVEEELERNGI